MRLMLALLIITSYVMAQSKPATLTRTDFVDFSFSVPESTVNFNFRNIGGANAAKVNGNFTVNFYVKGKLHHTATSKSFSVATLPPVNVKGRWVPKKFPFALSQSDLGLIQNGTGQMRVAGSLNHDDGTGKTVTMPFCYKYDFPAGMRGCSKP